MVSRFTVRANAQSAHAWSSSYLSLPSRAPPFLPSASVGKKIWSRRTAYGVRPPSAFRLSAAVRSPSLRVTYLRTFLSRLDQVRPSSYRSFPRPSPSFSPLTYLLFPLFTLRFSYRVDCPLDKNERRALIVDDCQWQERILSSQQIGRRFIVLYSIVIFFLFCLFRFAFTLHHIPSDEIRHWQNYLYKAICFSFRNPYHFCQIDFHRINYWREFHRVSCNVTKINLYFYV